MIPYHIPRRVYSLVCFSQASRPGRRVEEGGTMRCCLHAHKKFGESRAGPRRPVVKAGANMCTSRHLCKDLFTVGVHKKETSSRSALLAGLPSKRGPAIKSAHRGLADMIATPFCFERHARNHLVVNGKTLFSLLSVFGASFCPVASVRPCQSVMRAGILAWVIACFCIPVFVRQTPSVRLHAVAIGVAQVAKGVNPAYRE